MRTRLAAFLAASLSLALIAGCGVEVSEADTDGDGILDKADNCINVTNTNQADLDEDGEGDACDSDDDGDGVVDTVDNCPMVANTTQVDADGDGTGDACDDTNPVDSDSDGVNDDEDNCPNTANADQANGDGDSYGDACDNCPATDNGDQADSDSDDVGDACDNCPGTSNADQANSDGDSRGDACDNCPDDDNEDQANSDTDTVGDACDNCPDDDNEDQANSDADSHGDVCDNCPDDDNEDQADADDNGVGDVCEAIADADSDGVEDSVDNCPQDANAGQEDNDGDLIGDACDPDDDDDDVLDVDDCAPMNEAVGACTQYYADTDNDSFGDADSSQCLCFPEGDYKSTSPTDCNDDDENIKPGGTEACDGIDSNCDGVDDNGFPDLDGDSIADCVDPDDDGDGVDDDVDNCPLIFNDSQANADGADDGGDACDDDDDDDTVLDVDDNCPTVANVDQTDANDNGIGDDCEADWDNDTVDNFDGDGNPLDNCPWTPNTDQLDTDLDGTGDACDLDDDDDGDPDETDCAPLDAAISHSATEICGDEVDEDCSGSTDDGEGGDGCTDYYFDADNDTHGAKDIPPKCYCVPTGQYKATSGGDCNDDNEFIYPGATETCNGVDDNCDSITDETWAADLGDACDGDDADECDDGAIVCNASGTGTTCNDGPTTPNAQELCNGADDNCNGSVDETWPQKGDPCDGSDADQCEDGVWVCNASGTGVTCNDNASSVAEICDGQDNDCNGQTDEGCDDDGDGYCDINISLVGNPAVCPKTTSGSLRDCDDGNGDANPGATEECNGFDDDCNGQTDEDGTWPSSSGDANNVSVPVNVVTNGTGDPSKGTVTVDGTFIHTADADYYKWSSPTVPANFWMCRVTGLETGVKVTLEAGFRDASHVNDPVWTGVNKSGSLGNGGIFVIGLLPLPPMTLMGGIVPVTGVAPCKSDYKLECKFTNDPSKW